MSENTPVFSKEGPISGRFAAIIDQCAEHVTPVVGPLAPTDQVMILADLEEQSVVAIKVPTTGGDTVAYPLIGVAAIVALGAVHDLSSAWREAGAEGRWFGEAEDGRVWHFGLAPKPTPPVDAPE